MSQFVDRSCDASMLTFHISLHARSADVEPGTQLECDGRQVQALKVPHESLATPFGVSFEAASQALEQLPRMFLEPDGSFVWTSGQGEASWQVDGNLFDRDGRLVFVDLKGTCPAERFEDLLRALGWPATPVMIQLVRQAVFLDESEFRVFAANAQ